MKVQPLADRLLVKPEKTEEVTKGGIVIPDTAKEKPLKGEILARGKKVVEPELKKGVKVLFKKFSGSNIPYEGVELLLIREEDILALIKEEK